MLGRRSKGQAPASEAPEVEPIPVLPPEVERAARVELELNDARADLEKAKAEAAAAKLAYDVAVDAGNLADALAAKARVAQEETVADIAQRLCARLAAELQDLLKGAADAADAAERAEAQARAVEALAAYELAFRTKMPELTAGLRDLIRLAAVAELAREAAVGKGAQLPQVDGFRHVDGTLRVDVSRRSLDLWINEFGGQPFSDADQKLIRIDTDGAGVLQGHHHVHKPTRKRRYEEVTFRPSEFGQRAPALYEALVLPCLRADLPAGWSPLKFGTRPQDIIEALDNLEARGAQPRPAPELRTERRALEAPRDVRSKFTAASE